jgi:hypothetical protein
MVLETPPLLKSRWNGDSGEILPQPQINSSQLSSFASGSRLPFVAGRGARRGVMSEIAGFCQLSIDVLSVVDRLTQ